MSRRKDSFAKHHWKGMFRPFYFVALCWLSSVACVTAATPILTPAFAQRETAKIRLDNGLEAYLISDPAADKSSAGLCLEVGSWDDPSDAPGMAHYVEHLLFLGTEKFPDESEFDRFVGDHGGETNAHTGDLETCFFFAIDTRAFSEGLDRFSRFFKEPLFNPSGIARELSAIDQEWALRKQMDSSRLWLVQKELAHAAHPFHRYNHGNSSTLGNIPRERVIEWYRSHYSSNLMHLVIYSALPIGQLQELTRSLFSPIRNLDRAPFRSSEPLTDQQLQGSRIWMEPIQQERSITLIWELPQEFADVGDRRPEDLVGFVLGHEGTRSLLAQLKREGLAEAISSGGQKMGGDHFVFMIKITLTKAGLAGVDTVVERTFQAIESLKRKGIPQSLFADIQQMQRNRYQYQMRDKAYDTVAKYTPLMMDEPLANFPEQSLIIQKYDPALIQKFVTALTPQRVSISILAPPNEIDVALDRKERWTQVAYHVEAIPADTMSRWSRVSTHPEIDIPGTNPFIPHHLTMVSESSAGILNPKLIVDDTFGKVYFAHDQQYQVPMISWAIQILTPEIDHRDVTKTVLADLYVKSVTQALSDISYDAQMAGLELQIERDHFGISLTLNGYSESAALFLRQVLERLKSVRPDQASFRIYKEALRLEYTNFSRENALKQALEAAKSLIYQGYATEAEKAKVIRSIDHATFLEYLARLFRRNYSEIMLYGNMAEAEALNVWQMVRQTMSGEPYPTDLQPHLQIAQFPSDANPYEVEVKSKAKGNAVLLVIQDGPFSFRSLAIQQLLSQAMKAPFFSTLRTEQQTAYSLLNWDQEIERQLFSFFAAASSSHAVRDLLARFELMIESYLRRLGHEELPESSFMVLREALAAQLEQPPENMEEMGKLLNNLAFHHDANFNWKKDRAQAMRALNYKDFVAGAHEILGKNNTKRIAILLKGDFSQEGVLEYRKASNSKGLREKIQYQSRRP